jgi:hypothetical protein
MIDGGAMVEQVFHDIDMAVERRQQERRVPEFVLHIDRRAIGEQPAHHRRVTAIGGLQQRGRNPIVPVLDHDAVLESGSGIHPSARKASAISARTIA